MRVAHLFSLSGPHEHPSLPRLFGEAVVDVGDYGERCAFWIADANIYPVISVKEATVMSKICGSEYSYFHQSLGGAKALIQRVH